MENRFSRTELLLGKESVARISISRIAIAGLGGVGAYAAEALARCGIGYIRLIDFDSIKYSNFNRQLLAVENTVQQKKVDIAEQRLKQINPDCIIDKRPVFIDESNAGELIEGVDLVIDAIDSVSSKVSLLSKSVTEGKAIVSSMGAAARIDPLQVRTGDISESRICPLARIIRKRLHRRNIYSGIRCVYSIEPVDTAMVSEMDGEENFERGRPRPSLGSISYMPGVFGLVAAHEAIRLLLDENIRKESFTDLAADFS
ncbi:MAG TPA: tRNA threonylcarbamoyladenosine dehydratase [Chitinispirillaceae bacterium]|nr:tRNA threonylcarbamoyladenosine dehydratase [Chitinispirillaceae bacterium]